MIVGYKTARGKLVMADRAVPRGRRVMTDVVTARGTTTVGRFAVARAEAAAEPPAPVPGRRFERR